MGENEGDALITSALGHTWAERSRRPRDFTGIAYGPAQGWSHRRRTPALDSKSVPREQRFAVIGCVATPHPP